ncbi:expressed unknown protein [Seminavis robusta]|uniref:Uncharacterized protein n=1 Tax=Seminavis robusta TaxID=568900 RepID=A0A9N8E4V7_9STRA|nr:expressed unknown protein [Seminavis robusta]|eukprot:Sro544_g163622.1  (103) ;mRNA; f:7192-7500
MFSMTVMVSPSALTGGGNLPGQTGCSLRSAQVDAKEMLPEQSHQRTEQSCGGTVPENWFPSNLNVMDAFSSWGSTPVSLLSWRYKVSNEVIKPIWVGKVPVM